MWTKTLQAQQALHACSALMCRWALHPMLLASEAPPKPCAETFSPWFHWHPRDFARALAASAGREAYLHLQLSMLNVLQLVAHQDGMLGAPVDDLIERDLHAAQEVRGSHHIFIKDLQHELILCHPWL